jgi:hypothetical protein
MIGTGLVLFCCGLSVAGIVLYRYKKEKALLLEKIRNDDAPWEGEILQGEDVSIGKTGGYGEAVLDFYGNTESDGRRIHIGKVVDNQEEDEQ